MTLNYSKILWEICCKSVLTPFISLVNLSLLIIKTDIDNGLVLSMVVTQIRLQSKVHWTTLDVRTVTVSMNTKKKYLTTGVDMQFGLLIFIVMLKFFL